MSQELKDFIQKAREHHLTDQEIQQKLTAAGWEPSAVHQALTGEDLDVPTPPSQVVPASTTHPDPIPVVQNLSTRGFEYSLMFISLWASALSIGYILNNFIANSFSDSSNSYSSDYSSAGSYAFATTVLIVFLPIFAYMFLRLKKAELSDKNLVRDPSRRKLSHTTQLFAFITAAVNIVIYIYSLMEGSTATGGDSFLQRTLYLIVNLGIAGGIFAYYWRDEHRAQ